VPSSIVGESFGSPMIFAMSLSQLR